MVGKIQSLKGKLIEQAEKDMQEKGANRIDPEMYDAIKDLAEAEKACEEAEYYRSVVDSMGRQGYMPDGYQMNRYRRGYDARMGYEGDKLEAVRNMLNTATPDEKERMRAELRSML